MSITTDSPETLYERLREAERAFRERTLYYQSPVRQTDRTWLAYLTAKAAYDRALIVQARADAALRGR